MSASTPEADWMDSDDEASPAPARSSSRYKGVVPQPKGRWGAQIYERHARVWLGTFADEAAAARAYDVAAGAKPEHQSDGENRRASPPVAALRFRGRGGAVNFPGAGGVPSAAEMEFLAARPKSEVVDMLRKHTYDDELRQALRSGAGDRGASLSLSLVPRVALFEKAVTPSDVGRLNRLVVPKLHAEKHFPPLAAGDVDDAAPPVLLAFEDVAAGGKVWRFRYSYWSSSQSYVLTRGWSRFVREKGVVDGDTVAFSQAVAVAGDGEVGGKRRMFIECRKRKRNDDDDRGDDDCCPDGGARVVRLFGANIAAATTGD
nr:unnamed protein product [Digitaria exilis]